MIKYLVPMCWQLQVSNISKESYLHELTKLWLLKIQIGFTNNLKPKIVLAMQC